MEEGAFGQSADGEWGNRSAPAADRDGPSGGTPEGEAPAWLAAPR